MFWRIDNSFYNTLYIEKNSNYRKCYIISNILNFRFLYLNYVYKVLNYNKIFPKIANSSVWEFFEMFVCLLDWKYLKNQIRIYLNSDIKKKIKSYKFVWMAHNLKNIACEKYRDVNKPYKESSYTYLLLFFRC